jgi:hypothetical protein
MFSALTLPPGSLARAALEATPSFASATAHVVQAPQASLESRLRRRVGSVQPPPRQLARSQSFHRPHHEGEDHESRDRHHDIDQVSHE